MNDIPSVVKDALAAHAEREIVQDPTGVLTYASLDARANALAREIEALGAGPGQVVLLHLTNTRFAWIAYLAAWKTGATVAAVGDLTAIELAGILSRVHPCAHILEAGRLQTAKAAYASLGLTTHSLFTDVPSGDDSVRSVDSLGEDAVDRWRDTPADAPASIAFSSGTTGASKGIVLSHAAMLHVARGLVRIFRLQATDVAFTVHPLFHAWAQVAVLLSGLLSGAKTVLGAFRYPESLRELERIRVTVLHGPPAFVASLGQPRTKEFDFSSLRLLVTGGAPVSIAAMERVAALLPHVQIRQGYGCSEFCLASMDGVDDAPTPFGKVGKPSPGCEVIIVSPSGDPLPPGAEGEVTVRTPSMMSGYLDDPEATAKVLVNGVFRTGDLGFVDERGYLEISGRIKDIIIVNGENVSPGEVEQALLRYPGIVKASVIGVPHPASGEAVRAFIVPEPKANVDKVQLLAFLRERLSHNKVPKSIELLERLPETPTGKVRREILREQTRGGLDTACELSVNGTAVLGRASELTPRSVRMHTAIEERVDLGTGARGHLTLRRRGTELAVECEVTSTEANGIRLELIPPLTEEAFEPFRLV